MGSTESVEESRSKSAVVRQFTLSELSAAMVFCEVALALMLALAEGAAYLWRPIGIALYVVVLLLTLLWLFVAVTDSSENSPVDDSEIGAAFAIVGAFGLVVSFSELTRHLYMQIGGFTAARADYWHWLRFGSANLLEAVLLDMPNVYAWNLSEVRPTVTWSRTLVFVFRSSIEFLVIVALVKQVRVARKYWHNPRVEQQNYFGFIMLKLVHVILMAIWLIPLAIFVGAVVTEGLSIGATWSALRFGIPVLFGLWLTWHSLLAIGISGKWNKLFSVAGFAAGVWIVRESWPALRVLFTH